jgi:two-component system NtrC family response regulator
VELPELKDRCEDVVVLAQHFLFAEIKSLKLAKTSFSLSAIAALSSHQWPGNVRELQNRIRRALTIFNSDIITSEDLGLEDPPTKNRSAKNC